MREATPADLPHLKAIEAAADAVFEPVLGPLDWGAPSEGEWRARQPGFLLVVGEADDEVPVGFAHVLYVEGAAHLEQLAVHPDHHRQGLGTALVAAVRERAASDGHERLTLCTFAEVPWNRPYYEALGFEVVERLSPFERRLVEKEEQMGLMAYGPRVVMQVALRGQVTGE